MIQYYLQDLFQKILRTQSLLSEILFFVTSLVKTV